MVICYATSLALLLGCAPPNGGTRPSIKTTERSHTAPPAHNEISVWRLDELAQANQTTLMLQGPPRVLVAFDVNQAKLVHDVATRITRAATKGDMPVWLLVGTTSINAFATYQNGQAVIAITLGMVSLLKNDEGAWAALIGHELAHFRLGHHKAQQSRKESIEVGSTLAGLVLSAIGLGLGNFAADAAGKLVERSFSREDEHNADRTGLDYVKRAGFDAYGALRLQERLLETRQEASFTFLSTHPTGEDRVAAIRRLLEPMEPADSNDHSLDM